jgi:hypothetical protein
MKAATFHNTVLTLVSGYAEALAELEAARADAQQTLDLVKLARPVSPRVLKAAQAVLAAYDNADSEWCGDSLVELRNALAEMGA